MATDTTSPLKNSTASPQRAGQVTKWLRVGRVVASAYRNRWRFALGNASSFSGSTHNRLRVEQSVAYINRMYDDFVAHGHLTPADWQGKRVIELGPGDNVGVMLRFLASGAAEARCIDKFYSLHDPEHERRIYLALRDGLPEAQRERFDKAVDLSSGVRFNPELLSYVTGKGAQDADEAFPGEQFDLVLSRGVLQEVFEIDRAFAAMDALLAPGGRMVHKIDLRDYGMFSSIGLHPREFLTIPDGVYRMMAYDTDKPNRRMMDYYRDKMKELGYDARLLIASIVRLEGYGSIDVEFDPPREVLHFGEDYGEPHRRLVEEIRPRLAPRFRQLSEQDLLVGACFLVARKPEAQPPRQPRR